MANFYDQKIIGAGVNFGTSLVQGSGKLGGFRHVFVNLQGGGANGLVFPPIGGKVVNPFKGTAKAYAGDLVEYKIDGTVRLLKTYEVAAAATASATTIQLVRDGYHHIPFVGDVIMAAPDEITGTGTAVTVTAVSKSSISSGDIWIITVSEAIGVLSAGAVLVEAAEAGADKQMAVTNPNAFLPCDYDFIYDPAASDSDYEGARYVLTPCLANEDTKLIVAKMSKVPACVLALNKSKVDGWFNL